MPATIPTDAADSGVIPTDAADSADCACAFDTRAPYTQTVLGAPEIPARVGSLSCLVGPIGDGSLAASQPAPEPRCERNAPLCDGETLHIISTVSSDRTYTYTVVRADVSGIVAHYVDADGKSVDVLLVEVSR